MYDYLVQYGNLNLYMLTDEELLQFALRCVKNVNLAVHLIGYTHRGRGVDREFDLSNHELSELMKNTADLIDGFSDKDRSRYIDKIDALLFYISYFQGSSRSVKGYLKDLMSGEMRKWLRITTKRQLDA